MSDKAASEVRKGDLLVFHASNGRTLARVTGVETREDDQGRAELGINVTLSRRVLIVDLGWKTQFWTMWHYPEDRVERYDRQETRSAAR